MTQGISVNGTKKRTYQTNEGTVLEFRPVSNWTINHLNMKWEKTKPIPPKFKSENGIEDYYPTDARYVQDLRIWEQAKAAELNETMVRLGVLSEPPADFVAVYEAEFPDIEPKNIKVHWVYTLLGDEDTMTEFFNVLLGQTQITEAGLKEAAGTFPSTD